MQEKKSAGQLVWRLATTMHKRLPWSRGGACCRRRKRVTGSGWWCGVEARRVSPVHEVSEAHAAATAGGSSSKLSHSRLAFVLVRQPLDQGRRLGWMMGASWFPDAGQMRMQPGLDAQHLSRFAVGSGRAPPGQSANSRARENLTNGSSPERQLQLGRWSPRPEAGSRLQGGAGHPWLPGVR